MQAQVKQVCDDCHNTFDDPMIKRALEAE